MWNQTCPDERLCPPVLIVNKYVLRRCHLLSSVKRECGAAAAGAATYASILRMCTHPKLFTEQMAYMYLPGI